MRQSLKRARRSLFALVASSKPLSTRGPKFLHAMLASLLFAAPASHAAPKSGSELTPSAEVSSESAVHLYLLCNATNWNVDESNRLKESTDAGVLSVSFEVSHTWLLDAGDHCQLVQTNELNGWGTSQVYYATETTLSAPGSTGVGVGYQGVPLTYDSLGTHTVVFDRTTSMVFFDIHTEEPEPGLGMSLTGSVDSAGFTASHFHRFNSSFTLSNTGEHAFTVERSLFFFAGPGGFAYNAPSTAIWWEPATIQPGASWTQNGEWVFSAPVHHMVQRLDATAADGTRASVTHAAPVSRAGYDVPDVSPYGGDVTIGFLSPLQLLPLANGLSWIGATVSVVDMTNSVGVMPNVTAEVIDADANVIAQLDIATPWEFWDPIRQVLAYGSVPHDAEVEAVRVTADYGPGSGLPTVTRAYPVSAVQAITVASPVSGRWTWGNGPGETQWHVHTGSAEGRYSYDLFIQDENGMPVSGDDSVNENFYSWGEPIYAVGAGTVVYVKDDTPDNPGQTNYDSYPPNNEITVQHGDGTYSRYAHMIQGSALVSVGQSVNTGEQLASVGNAGASSAPHLHFHVFRIDSTGQVQAVPVRISGMETVEGLPVSGIPVDRTTYDTP